MKAKTLYATIISIILMAATFNSMAQTFTNYSTTNGLPDNFCVGGIAVDTNNNVWVGTAAGIAKFDGTSWLSLTTTQGLVDNYTNCIAVDKNNNIWVGTNMGISKFNGTTFTTYTIANGLIDNGVKYINVDMNNNLWIGTDVGVSKYNGSTFTNYTVSDGLPTNVITYITSDTLNNKWFATEMGGISKYNNATFTTISTITVDSLLDNNTFAIAVDKFENKWIGTWMGITKINAAGNWVANYRTIDGMYNDYVRDLKFDSKGNLWIGLFADYNLDGGISRFNGTNWISYTTADGLADKQVIRLAVDKNDDIWIATGNGVSKLTSPSAISVNNQERISVYPNPVSDYLFIQLKNHTTQFTISDITGKTISHHIISENSNKIDVSNLSPGVYLLQIIGKTETSSVKFVKQ